jgi:PPM family protein phosphatase
MNRSAPLMHGVATDAGQQRSNNEDLPYVDEAQGLYAVVDGVGGEAAGEEASKTAVEAIQSRFEDPGGDTEERIREAIALANNRIYQTAQEKPQQRGMACVLTLAVIEGRTVTVGHVGDSRLYRIRNGQMEKITPDHSPVGEREDRGELTEAEAMAHPRRNEVYRDVGSELHQPNDPGFIDILRTSLPADAAILLSSDGLTDMLTREQMLRVIETYDGDPHRIARDLVRAANEAGGKDNITVLFIPGSGFAQANGHSTTRRIASKPSSSRSPDRAQRREFKAVPIDVHGNTGDSTPQPSRSLRWWLILAGVLILAGGAFVVLESQWGVQRFHLRPAKIRVGPGQRYSSIAAGLAAAREGDSVIVAPGVYAENVLLKAGVALVSAQARKAEIQASGTAVDVQSITGARISGFRISPDGSNTLQIGLRARDAEVHVDNTEIQGASDAGIVIEGDSTAELSKNFIHGNAKAGLRVDSTILPHLDANRICDNGQDVIPALPPAAAAANLTGTCTAGTQKPAVESRETGNHEAGPQHRATEGRPRREPRHE